MKKLITVIILAWGTIAFAAALEVTDVVAKQRYPWNGLVDITCKVTGIEGTTNGLYFTMAAVYPDSGNVQRVWHFEIIRAGANSPKREVQTNGNYRLLWNAHADLGEVNYSNMVVNVTLGENKVQLWEGGPYWADTNIGAEVPWEYGYYFWWGDTVGYKREGDAWVASNGSSSNFSFSESNTPTFGKGNATLQNQGWITADGVLAPEHDAAHVHWGGDWRMPTSDEIQALVDNCTTTWITINGVSGRLVTGKGNYANRSIFLPAAGLGYDSSLLDPGSYGDYWSSTPNSGNSYNAWYLNFYSGNFGRDGYGGRCRGRSVRPVRGFAE